MTYRSHFYIHFLSDCKEQDARILQSPRNVGNRKIAVDYDGVIVPFNSSHNRQGMRTTVDGHHAAYTNRELPWRSAMAFDLLWLEPDFRKALNLKDAIVHSSVAHAMTAVPAGRIDD